MKRLSNAAVHPLNIALISIHGLIRGHDLELGRDADTGGQTKYVVELARALGQHKDVAKVTLFTRQVVDERVSADYAVPIEPISNNVHIVRVACGPKAYLRKELLWDHLDSFADSVVAFFKSQGSMPDILHSHYADAGYVGVRLSHQLGIPLVHTGHSLGRAKRKQLLASGVSRDDIESTYNIRRRIEAEETTLGVAERVITSTRQEIEQQYAMYDFYQPERMRIVAPGTDLQAFYPPKGRSNRPAIAQEVNRFLRDPNKPFVLALSRPDPKKNIVALIEAYGESKALQDAANLVIVAGNRDDIGELSGVARSVLNDILLTIDKYDLYGKVAYPKHHSPSDVPNLYRMAVASRGVFVNPALTEPFGLTLIEAAACGLPLVATSDGGPVDIINNCQNGFLIDPLDNASIAAKLLDILTDSEQWKRFSSNGIKGVHAHYSWPIHVINYVSVVRPLVKQTKPPTQRISISKPARFREKALFTSLDLNLTGDQASLEALLQVISANRKSMLFGVATGRHLDDALTELRRHHIPEPDVLITHQGSKIHYAPDLTHDIAWEKHINHHWNPQEVRALLDPVPGLTLQPKACQSMFKVSYFFDPAIANPQAIRQILLRNDQAVNAIFSFGHFLDILPIRASKGLALRWSAARLGFQLQHTLVAGVTGADADMLRGNTLGVVVSSQHPDELCDLAADERVHFSKNQYAAGILEAMDHYQFLTQPKAATDA